MEKVMIIQVFDKPMCCSTGVCGPEVDQTLVRFAADLDWLRRQGVHVERYSLSQQPREFAQQADVRSLLQSHSMDALPIIVSEGRVVSQGTYPNRASLASWGQVAPQAVPQTALPVIAAGCCQSGRGSC